MRPGSTRSNNQALPAGAATKAGAAGQKRPLQRTDLLGVPIDSGDHSATLAVAEHLTRSNKPEHIATLSFGKLLRARRDVEYERYLRQAGAVVATSSLVAGGAHFTGRTGVTVHNLFDLVIRLLTAAEQQERTVYLLGGSKAVLEQAERNLRPSFPRLRVVGRFTGGYSAAMEQTIVQAIQKASPGLLLVGSGVRGRELWLLRNKEQLRPGLALWVDECFEVFAGKKRNRTARGARRALGGLGKLLVRPWRVFGLFALTYYLLLLLVYRIRGL